MPKYMQVAQQITNQILQKEFVKQLPSENELIEQYEVSRNTIRNAINVLASQGLIRRVQGSGYYINQHILRSTDLLMMGAKNGIKPEKFRKDSLKNDINSNSRVKSKVVHLDDTTAKCEVAAMLECDESTPIYYCERVRFLNGNLLCLEKAYYLKEFVPFLNEDICKKSIFDFIKKQYKIETESADDFIKLVTISQEDAKLVDKEAGAPAINIREINYLKNNRPFNCSSINYFDENLTFYYHLDTLISH